VIAGWVRAARRRVQRVIPVGWSVGTVVGQKDLRLVEDGGPRMSIGGAEHTNAHHCAGDGLCGSMSSCPSGTRAPGGVISDLVQFKRGKNLCLYR